MAHYEDEKQKEKLELLNNKEAEELTRIMAQRYKLPYLNLFRTSIDLDALKLIPESEAREAGLAIVQAIGKKLQVVVKNPTLSKTRETLKQLERSGFIPQIFIASLISLERAWERYKEIPKENVTTEGMINISDSTLKEIQKKDLDIRLFQNIFKKRVVNQTARKVTQTLDIILAGAFQLEASDIHIEPGDTEARFRLRLDGVLQDISNMPMSVYKRLNSRIKLTAELKLNVRERAQDGRFTIKAADTFVEVRVSTLPGPYGESIVMRILHPKSIGMTLEDLGMLPPLFKLIDHEIRRANGLIFTTGPTGSGKTTTLYAFIKKIKKPGIKIITIEDPIEYHLAGITQTQINKGKGYTFENGLSSIVRQDPDIILVGEVRNLETATTAMHASLTGHLVFSTLHTNNAPATIPRLIDIGVRPNIIGPSINVTMAQRLVRRLCSFCKAGDDTTDTEMTFLQEQLKDLPPDYEKEKPDLSSVKVYRPRGCEKCNFIGYKGRVGIFEAFIINDEIEKLILQNPSEAEVREAAKKEGMITLQQDGALKIALGMTSFEELDRVAGL